MKDINEMNVFEYMEYKQADYTGKTNKYHYITSSKYYQGESFGGRIFESEELGCIFNMDAFNLPLDEETKNFINSVEAEFVKIPTDLLDYTTSQNFNCYIARI